MTQKQIRPFLLLQTREDDRTQADEYRSTLQISGLRADQLISYRLEKQRLGQLDLRDYSGIILCGSPFTSTDSQEQKTDVQKRVEEDLHTLLDVLVAEDFPFLGACYGVGSLAIHQGAVVDNTYGEAVHAIDITFTEEGQKDPLAAGLPPVVKGFVGHKEAVRQLPSHATLLATGVDCPVQMFRIQENLYATQFHPEMDFAGLAHRVHVYKHNGYFEPHEVDAIIKLVENEDVSGSHRVLTNFVNHYRQAR